MIIFRSYPMDETIAFYERKAGGGAATEYRFCRSGQQEGRSGLNNPGLDDPQGSLLSTA